MASAPPLPSAAGAPPSTEWLRRQALARSQRRGAQVARRRLAWRWAWWGVGRLLRWLLWPALAVALAAIGMGFWQQMPTAASPATAESSVPRARVPAAASAAVPATPISPTASPAASPAASPPSDALARPAQPALPLRLDADEPVADPSPSPLTSQPRSTP